jgi:energy-converting hydrogenase Eha subunit C
MNSKLIEITAADYSDGSKERTILERLGAELKIGKYKNEKDVIAAIQGVLSISVTRTPIRELARKSLTFLKNKFMGCRISMDYLDLAMMKPTAYLIITTRGLLFDHVTLVQELKDHQIACVRLDMMEGDLEGTRKSSKFDNIINTPHTLWFSRISFNSVRKSHTRRWLSSFH